MNNQPTKSNRPRGRERAEAEVRVTFGGSINPKTLNSINLLIAQMQASGVNSNIGVVIDRMTAFCMRCDFDPLHPSFAGWYVPSKPSAATIATATSENKEAGRASTPVPAHQVPQPAKRIGLATR